MLMPLCCPTPGNPNVSCNGQQLLSLFNTWSVCRANWQAYVLFKSLFVWIQPVSTSQTKTISHLITLKLYINICQYLLLFLAFNSMFVTISKAWLSYAAALRERVILKYCNNAWLLLITVQNHIKQGYVFWQNLELNFDAKLTWVVI